MTHPAHEIELPSLLEQAENLPSLPAVAVEVLRLTEDEDSTLDELATTLGRDPVLSAKLLKLSNSSLFGAGAEITTLQRAAMVLGLKTVKLMSLSFSLVGTLPKHGMAGGFDFALYWRHSLVRAVVARSLARLVGHTEFEDEAFLCGLLGYLGKLVLARCLPEQYDNVIAASGPWPTLDDEEREFGFHSADIGAALLKEWGIPTSVRTAVLLGGRTDAATEALSPPVAHLLRLMRFASLGEAVLCNEEKGRALREMHTIGAAEHGLGEQEIDSFLLGLEAGIHETAEMLSVQFPDQHSHEEILDRARRQIVHISLGTAVDLRQERQRNEALVCETRDLRERATTDALTGLPNRAAFDEALAYEVRSRIVGRLPRALGLVLLDIDKFKNFNDTHGHQTGDEVLRMVGGVLLRATRKGDLAARYGGEEFVVLAPQTTPFGLRILCERLRERVQAGALEVDGMRLSVTACFGAACITGFKQHEDGAALLKLADRFLYRAKKNGRNRCEVFPRVQFPGR